MANRTDVDIDYLASLGREAGKGNDISFTEIIKVFPCIYNKGSAQFKDRNLKANAWQQIAKYMMADKWVENKAELKSEVAKCKQSYESIRTLDEQAPIESCHLWRVNQFGG